MRRFTVAPEAVARGRVVFDAAESRHLARVLRLRPGDTVVVSDGTGHEYTVRLEAVGERTSGVVLDVSAGAAESPLAVTLGQAVPKGDGMERIVRATTELGIARVTPLVTARTVVRLDPARWRERSRRWQRIAREATKQCGRAVVPEIDPPQPLDAWLQGVRGAELALCLWEGGGEPLTRVLAGVARPRSVCLLVGPEGGLEPAEAESAGRHGFVATSLGPRILRTETVGPAVLAVLQSRWGDLGA